MVLVEPRDIDGDRLTKVKSMAGDVGGVDACQVRVVKTYMNRVMLGGRNKQV